MARGYNLTAMPESKELTAIITMDADMFVALCPELDIASQGNTQEEAQTNLVEALELFFECASASEQVERLGRKAKISRIEVRVG